MISFLGESIKNRFPYWSKIRKDPSSHGASLLDILGSSLEEIRINALRSIEQRKVFSENPTFENDKIQIISLLEDEAFRNQEQLNKSAPLVSVEGDGISLREVEDIESLSKANPNRVELLEELETNNTVFEGNESSDSERYFGEKGSHLFIEINGEGVFQNKNSIPFFEEHYYIVLRGEDITGSEIEEYIYVTDEKIYRSANRFKRLKGIKRDLTKNIAGGTAVEQVGFDSSFKISIAPFGTKKEYIKFLLSIDGVKKSIEEGFVNDNELLIKLEKVNGLDVLNYYLIPYNNGKYYRYEGSGSEKHFLIHTQSLKNEYDEDINVKDFCYDKVRNKLTVIDSLGDIYFYDLGKQVFLKTGFGRTKRTNIDLEPSLFRVNYGEKLSVNVHNYKQSLNINKVIIGREKPSERDDVSTFEERIVNLQFLQEDKTWSPNVYMWEPGFVYQEANNENWSVVAINDEIDEYGQWDYYCFEVNENFEEYFSEYNNGTITLEVLNKYLKKDYKKLNNECLVSTTSILCEINRSNQKISTGLLLEGESEETVNFGIHKDLSENLLFVYKETEEEKRIFKYKEISDVYLFDRNNKILGLKEKYTNVKVNYNNLVIEASYD